MVTLKQLINRFNFLDEKQFVNHDCIRRKIRRDPLTGKIPAIYVSGNFRDAHNIFACISASEQKRNKPIAYQIERRNGTAKRFLDFICNMIATQWLRHDKVLIMDNAAIHVGKESRVVKDLLWETVIDGIPLRILVVYLPPRCPELNPIEKIFHILSKRVQRFKETETTEHAEILKVVTNIMDNLCFELIKITICSCNYSI